VKPRAEDQNEKGICATDFDAQAGIERKKIIVGSAGIAGKIGSAEGAGNAGAGQGGVYPGVPRG
jgi:hypothetical protein